MSKSDKQTGNNRTVKGQFTKGNKESPGRQKGSKNKFTSLKESFLEAFEELGGVEGLAGWAKKNNTTQGQFYQMISKMLPSNADLDVKGALELTIKRIISDERPKQ